MHRCQHSKPLNIGLLVSWTFCLSYLVGYVAAVNKNAGNEYLVLEALVLNATAFITLTMCTYIYEIDMGFIKGKEAITPTKNPEAFSVP